MKGYPRSDNPLREIAVFQAVLTKINPSYLTPLVDVSAYDDIHVKFMVVDKNASNVNDTIDCDVQYEELGGLLALITQHGYLLGFSNNGFEITVGNRTVGTFIQVSDAMALPTQEIRGFTFGPFKIGAEITANIVNVAPSAWTVVVAFYGRSREG